MASLIVAVFKDEEGAHDGARFMCDLHTEGALTLYAIASVARDAGAGLVIRQPLSAAAATTAPAIGAAVGVLVTLLGGPVTTVTRSIATGLVSAVRDLDESGFDARFLDRVSRRMRTGSGAFVAEAEEEQRLPLDARILAHGGRLFRHRLAGALLEERMIRELTALRAEMRPFQGTQPGETHTGAEATVRRNWSDELRGIVDQARSRARALRMEAEAKVAVLRSQAAALDGEARQRVEQRAAAVRSSFHSRAARLESAADSVGLPRPRRKASSRWLGNV